MNISVQDRVLIHLLENNSQADKYLVDIAMTRPGIAASCALSTKRKPHNAQYVQAKFGL